MEGSDISAVKNYVYTYVNEMIITKNILHLFNKIGLMDVVLDVVPVWNVELLKHIHEEYAITYNMKEFLTKMFYLRVGIPQHYTDDEVMETYHFAKDYGIDLIDNIEYERPHLKTII